jgi:hypothetical protein
MQFSKYIFILDLSNYNFTGKNNELEIIILRTLGDKEVGTARQLTPFVVYKRIFAARPCTACSLPAF